MSYLCSFNPYWTMPMPAPEITGNGWWKILAAVIVEILVMLVLMYACYKVTKKYGVKK